MICYFALLKTTPFLCLAHKDKPKHHQTISSTNLLLYYSQSVYFHKQINKKKCNSQQTSQLHHFDPKTISSTISVPLLFSTNHSSFQDPPKPSKICSFQTPNHHKKSYLELQQLMPLCLKLHSCGLVDFAFTMPS